MLSLSHLFVVALILVLSWHYRGEGGVDLKGGESSCFVPNLCEDIFQEDLSNLFVLATSAFSLNRPTPKMTLALSRGPAYNNLLLKPSCTSSTAGKAAHSCDFTCQRENLPLKMYLVIACWFGSCQR